MKKMPRKPRHTKGLKDLPVKTVETVEVTEVKANRIINRIRQVEAMIAAENAATSGMIREIITCSLEDAGIPEAEHQFYQFEKDDTTFSKLVKVKE